jgi:hypothetical protein
LCRANSDQWQPDERTDHKIRFIVPSGILGTAHCLYPGKDCIDAEGFRDVTISACSVRGSSVVLGISDGNNDDWHI